MNRIKELRIHKNLTLKTLSKELNKIYGMNISDGQLSNYENEKRTPRKLDTWKFIADYFNVSTGYLMGISNQIIDEQSAIKIAKSFYFDYLSDEKISDDDRKSLKYFNNENLDGVLYQAVVQFFSDSLIKKMLDPVEAEQTEYSYKLEKAVTDLLKIFLKKILLEKYRTEVKTNQNLITNTYYKIPSTIEIYKYNEILTEIVPFSVNDPKIISIFQKAYPNVEISKIKKLLIASCITSSLYENSIDMNLKKELTEILDDTRAKIDKLKDKYRDRPSKVVLNTSFTCHIDNQNLAWVQFGDEELKDDINLPDEVKKFIIKLSENHIKEN